MVWTLLLAVALPLVIGGVGGAVTARSVTEWYPSLTKPSWTPPPALFGPVWTLLYLMMGWASWLVWRQGWSEPAVRPALLAYLVQLALNGVWSWIFFGLHSLAGGLLDIVALWLALGVTVALFARVSPAAAVVLLPYWAWVTFATALNGAIWAANR